MSDGNRNNVKTLIEIEDLTLVRLIIPVSDGKLHVLIGEEGEHQVEIVASPRTLGRLAASIVDEVSDRVGELESQLREWVKTG